MKLLSKILIHTHGINTHQWACSFLFKLCLHETLATCETDINSYKKKTMQVCLKQAMNFLDTFGMMDFGVVEIASVNASFKTLCKMFINNTF